MEQLETQKQETTTSDNFFKHIYNRHIPLDKKIKKSAPVTDIKTVALTKSDPRNKVNKPLSIYQVKDINVHLIPYSLLDELKLTTIDNNLYFVSGGEGADVWYSHPSVFEYASDRPLVDYLKEVEYSKLEYLLKQKNKIIFDGTFPKWLENRNKLFIFKLEDLPGFKMIADNFEEKAIYQTVDLFLLKQQLTHFRGWENKGLEVIDVLEDFNQTRFALKCLLRTKTNEYPFYIRIGNKDNISDISIIREDLTSHYGLLRLTNILNIMQHSEVIANLYKNRPKKAIATCLTYLSKNKQPIIKYLRRSDD